MLDTSDSTRSRPGRTRPRLLLIGAIAGREIRRATGVTVIAIIRGAQAITAPEPSEIMRAGDRLVVASRPQDLGGFRELVVG